MDTPHKKKYKKVPRSKESSPQTRGRRVRRVRKSSLSPVEAQHIKKIQRKPKNKESLEIDTSFYEENPVQHPKKRVHEEQSQKKMRNKNTEGGPKKKRGCRDFLLGGCSFLFILNLIVMSVVGFYAKSALDAFKEKDTEAIINFLDEKLQDENNVLYQSLLEGIVTPELEKGLGETVGNTNINTGADFPIFPDEEDALNTNAGF